MGLWPFLFAALVFRACPAPSVSYDERSLILDGARVFTLSGSVHYQRVLPADWPRVLQLAVEMGLNSIQTCVSSASTAQGENRETYAPHPPPPLYPNRYVQWDQHEAVEGVVSFSGQHNITAFVALAGSLGLRVHVRIGPYIVSF